ncbi:uncharacterized protein LOC114531542 [Dendronephthya gigantea]|uniref:uncharacterized protein LOC114531542 n=1 Tax=Dendronephthya gigantea TaxID=151771 RepID=UPI00106B44E5|nr:uncharacterized protein LOC114531542 [Dendronephthya gigantea]
MSKIWRNFVIGFAAIICFWVFAIRIVGIDNYGVRNSTHFILNYFQSWRIPYSTKSKNKGLFITLPSNSCPANENRKAFAALLHQWHKLASFYKIPYVIGCGSLLGQYRDGDIIPWDQDVDVLVDITKFKALKAFGGKRNFQQGSDDKFHFVVQKDFMQKEEEDDRRRFSCTGEVVDLQMDSCSFVSPMARLIRGFVHLDVFPFLVDRDKQKVRDPDMAATYNLKDFFPLKKCVFMDVITWCPSKVRLVLETAYGNIAPHYQCVNRTWVKTGN